MEKELSFAQPSPEENLENNDKFSMDMLNDDLDLYTDPKSEQRKSLIKEIRVAQSALDYVRNGGTDLGHQESMDKYESKEDYEEHQEAYLYALELLRSLSQTSDKEKRERMLKEISQKYMSVLDKAEDYIIKEGMLDDPLGLAVIHVWSGVDSLLEKDEQSNMPAGNQDEKFADGVVGAKINSDGSVDYSSAAVRYTTKEKELSKIESVAEKNPGSAGLVLYELNKTIINNKVSFAKAKRESAPKLKFLQERNDKLQLESELLDTIIDQVVEQSLFDGRPLKREDVSIVDAINQIDSTIITLLKSYNNQEELVRYKKQSKEFSVKDVIVSLQALQGRLSSAILDSSFN